MRPPAVGAKVDGGRRVVGRAPARRASGADRRFRRRRQRQRVGRGARGARAQGALERQRAADRPRGAWSTGRAAARSSPRRRSPTKGDAARIAALADARRRALAPPTPGRSSRMARSARRAPSPTCAPTARTVWTASQASHRFLNVFAALLELPRDKLRVDLPRRRRLLRHERARRCRGRCGAAVEGGRQAGARAMEPRGRARLGPQGPAAAARARRRRSTPEGRIDAWETEMWVPRATANLRMGAAARRRWPRACAQPVGQSTGLVSQNGDPPYAANAVQGARRTGWGRAAAAVEHPRAGQGRELLRGRELRRRAGGAGAASIRSQFRLRDLADPRGVEVLRRHGAMIGWQARPSPAAHAAARVGARPRHRLHPLQAQRDLRRRSRMEVEVERSSGGIRVRADLLRPRLRPDDQSRCACARRSRATSCRRCRARCTRRSPSTARASPASTGRAIRCCASPRCRGSRSS